MLGNYNDENFIIESELEDDVNILSIKGSILTERINNFTEELMKHVNSKRVVLDLQGTDFISSSGLGAIVSFTQKIRGNNGELVIASPKKFVMKTLKITQISSVIQIFSSVDSAIDDMILKDF
ncbi:STAS domain-containing protein [bacterium]|nr:STAS domain-containing protein [bacterium]